MGSVRWRLVAASLAGSVAGAVLVSVLGGGGLGDGALPVVLVLTATTALAVYLAAAALSSSLREIATRVASGVREHHEGGGLVGRSEEVDRLVRASQDLATALANVERTVAAERERFNAVLAHMGTGVLFIDHRGRLRLANAVASRMLGLSEADIGRGHVEAIRDFHLSELIDEVLKYGRGLKRELTLIHAGERQVEAGCVIVGGREGNEQAAPGAGVVVVLHDVTERWRLERLRAEFIANVSHELRTPVTAIKGFAETLLEGALEEPDARRRFVAFIDREAQRLGRMVQELLELVRFEEKQVSLVRREVDLTDLVVQTVERARPEAAKLGLRLGTSVPPRPLYAFLDADRIEQVIANLLDNAFKFTPPGGQVTVGVEQAGDGSYILSVADTGQGMPAEEVGLIFERFYRVDKGRSRAKGGTGLGLAIVKQIVEAHGGRAWATSAPGAGATFFVTIPRWAPEPPAQIPPGGGGTIEAPQDGTAG